MPWIYFFLKMKYRTTSMARDKETALSEGLNPIRYKLLLGE
jgi:hypothetical protein